MTEKIILSIFGITTVVALAGYLVCMIHNGINCTLTPLAYRREKLRKYIDNPPEPKPVYDGYIEEVPQEQLNKIIAEITKKRTQRVCYIKTDKD